MQTQLLSELSTLLEAPVTLDTELLSTGLWDSMAIVVVVTIIDELYGVHVPGVRLIECKTPRDILEMIAA